MTVVSSGQLTLTNINDTKQLILYLNNNYKTQIYDPNGSGTYTPNFTTQNLTITPELYIAGGSGTNLLPSSAVTTLQWFEGSQTVTPLAQSAAGTTPNGYSYSLPVGPVASTAQTLTIKSNLTTKSQIYTCQLIYTDPATNFQITVKANFEVLQVQNGVTGLNTQTVVLSNDNVTLGADENGNVATYVPTPTDIHVFDGSTELTYDGTGTANGKYKVTTAVTSGTMTAGTITANGIYCTAGAASGMTTANATVTYTITGKSQIGTAFTMTKQQTFTKANTGVAPLAYWLVLDSSTIKLPATGIFSPASINLTSKSQKGANAPANYTGRFIIEESTNGGGSYTTKYTSAADEATKNYVPSGITVTNIRCSLYQSGGTTVLLDQQIVNIVADGTQAVTAVLSNDSATIATDENGANGVYTGAGTDIHVFDGTTELTYDGTGTAQGKYKVTTAVSGITAGAISLNGIYATAAAPNTITTSTATITYTITGMSNSNKAFTVTKVQNFSMAKTGVAPYTYWLVTDTSSVKKDVNNNYTPTSYNLTGKSQKGANAPANQTCRIKVEYSTDGSTYNVSSNALYNASADTSVFPLNVPMSDAPAGVKLIKLSMYQAGGTTVLLDQQIITIVVDGATGINSYYLNTWAPNGDTIRNSGSDMLIEADMYSGANQVTPTAFKWYVQDSTATTSSGGDADGGNGWRLINSVAAPTTAATLALSADASSQLTPQTYYVKYTNAGLSGETVVTTTEASLAVTSGNDLKVTVPSYMSALYLQFSKVYVGTITGGPYYWQGDATTGGTAEKDTLTITAAATATGNVTVTLNGVAYNVAVASGDTTSAVATKIAAASFGGFYTASAVGAVVTFQANFHGTTSAPSYSAGTTGATGSIVVTTAGANDYVLVSKLNTNNPTPPTVNSATNVTAYQLTIRSWALPGVEGYKCVATAPVTGIKYTGVIVVKNFQDPISVNLIGGSVFKNGAGTLTIQAQLLQAGVQIPTTGYTFVWSLYNMDGSLNKTYPAVSGDTITIPASDVATTENLVVTVNH